MCKRLRLLSVVAIILLFCVSCVSSKKASHEIITNFSADVTLTMGQSQIGCTLTRATQDVGTIVVTSPEPLSNMCFLWQGNKYGISYQGLECSTEQPFLPNSSFAAALMNVLKTASDPELLKLMSQKNNQEIYSGECDSGKFELAANSNSGFIEEITVADLNLKATFTNHK